MISSISGSSNFSQVARAEMQQRMFSKIDANGDGKIGKDELTQMVAKGPQGGPSADDIMSKLDTDGDSSISQSEFEASMANGTNSAQASNARDKLAETLLAALENETKTASSTGGSGSQSSTSATSIAAMLSNAIKSYMQSGSNNWSQTNALNLLGAGLQV